jgi:hypothetical protein
MKRKTEEDGKGVKKQKENEKEEVDEGERLKEVEEYVVHVDAVGHKRSPSHPHPFPCPCHDKEEGKKIATKSWIGCNYLFKS